MWKRDCEEGRIGFGNSWDWRKKPVPKTESSFSEKLQRIKKGEITMTMTIVIIKKGTLQGGKTKKTMVPGLKRTSSLERRSQKKKCV